MGTPHPDEVAPPLSVLVVFDWPHGVPLSCPRPLENSEFDFDIRAARPGARSCKLLIFHHGVREYLPLEGRRVLCVHRCSQNLVESINAIPSYTSLLTRFDCSFTATTVRDPRGGRMPSLRPIWESWSNDGSNRETPHLGLGVQEKRDELSSGTR